MNSETLGWHCSQPQQFGIFSTRFKGFETEFTTKSSLRLSLTIHMALSQRITRVGKDPYLLELSELHQIGVHVQPSLRRTTLLLAPLKTDGPNGRKSRENELSLSRNENPHSLPIFQSLHVFVLKMKKMNTVHLSSYYH